QAVQDAGVWRSWQRWLGCGRHIEVQRQVAHAPHDLVGSIPDRAEGVHVSALSAPAPARLCALGSLSTSAGPVEVRNMDVENRVFGLFEELPDHPGDKLIRRTMRR